MSASILSSFITQISQHVPRDFAIVERNCFIFQDLIRSRGPFRPESRCLRSRLPDGRADGFLTIRLDYMGVSKRRRPTRASFMMAMGSSERGLSEVSTTKSLASPARPAHQRTLSSITIAATPE